MPEQQNPSSSSSPHSGVLWVNSQHSWRENTKNSREKHNWSWANRYLQHTALGSSLVQSWGVNGPSERCFLRVLKIWRKLKDCKNAWFLEAITEGKAEKGPGNPAANWECNWKRRDLWLLCSSICPVCQAGIAILEQRKACIWRQLSQKSFLNSDFPQNHWATSTVPHRWLPVQWGNRKLFLMP